MAIYKFRDVLYGVERQSTLRAVRALFILARHDIEMKHVYEPTAIEHQGRTYTKQDILSLTTYSSGRVTVLLPAEEEGHEAA